MPSDSDLLTAAQAAEILGVSRVTIYRWLKQGRLSGSRRRGRTVLAASEVHGASRQRHADTMPALLEDILSRRRKGWRMRVISEDSQRLWFEVRGPSGERHKAQVSFIE